MESSTTKEGNRNSGNRRLAAVQEMAAFQRILFEVEREFVRTATTLIYRVGEIELKYLLCQHVWESAGHARFLRERGREMSGFGKGESVRAEFRQLFEEAILADDPADALAGFYRIIKPAILSAYRQYLELTHHLADWPSRHLVEEFIQDEERHASEMDFYLDGRAVGALEVRLEAALGALGGWLGKDELVALPDGFQWLQASESYQHRNSFYPFAISYQPSIPTAFSIN